MRSQHPPARSPQEARFDPIDESRWEKPGELLLCWIALLATLLATGLTLREQYSMFATEIAQRAWLPLVAHVLFCIILVSLISGSLVYTVTRLGYIQRRRRHQPLQPSELDSLYANPAPSLLIMVPSYREERRTIWETLLSAALQEYPRRRVVLLIDDPILPTTPEQAAGLEQARRIPYQLQALLDEPAQVLADELERYERHQAQAAVHPRTEVRHIAELWEYCAAWFEGQSHISIADHCDRLFVDQVLRARQQACLNRARQLRSVTPYLEPAQMRNEYRKLAALFDVAITCFERKAFVNLSWESNKAMNLNSYISLVGHSYVIRNTPEGPLLEETTPQQADFSVPPADFLIVLDADSLLLPQYAARLIHILQQPGNERIAVAQTPYSAFRGAPGLLERLAGATTDMQYLIHQGSTRHQATYWVGANALIRRCALDDIVVTESERGYPVKRYIQDRTVIEDTESTVDLASRGWRLYNYPERLTYSATPPDFGSLVIQRRRWANGGLIILPKLLRYLLHQPLRPGSLMEGLLRIHYLISITLVNLGLLILITLPLFSQFNSLWGPLVSLPYFILYGHDLVLSGYRGRDLYGVYALNLLLLPVNLAGVVKSIQQGVTGEKIPFGRTPKVSGRTASAPGFILAVYLLIGVSLFGSATDFSAGRTVFALLTLFNGATLLYALVRLVGLRESWEDLRAGQWERGFKAAFASMRAIFF